MTNLRKCWRAIPWPERCALVAALFFSVLLGYLACLAVIVVGNAPLDRLEETLGRQLLEVSLGGTLAVWLFANLVYGSIRGSKALRRSWLTAIRPAAMGLAARTRTAMFARTLALPGDY